MQQRHNKDEQRDQNDGDPGAVAELGHQDDQGVTPVANAPNPLTSIRWTRPGESERFQWITMPAWESVNARKAPIANSGMRRSVTREHCQQKSGEADKRIDAMRVEQPAAADLEDVGWVVLFRNGAGETGKIRERGIGRERKH